MLKQSELFGLLLFVLCFLIQDVWSNELATPEQEAVDERHDAEILRAVINSMAEWEKRHKHIRRKRAPEKKVCYDELGCFEASGPFHYLDTVPSPPAEIGTQFLMYPPRNDVSDIVDGRRNVRSSLDSAPPGPDEPPVSGDRAFTVPSDNMTMAWDWVKHGHFNTSLPTKVVVHGFGSSCDLVWVYELRSSLLRYDNCNMICVDWAGGAIVPNYVRAATNTRLVGAQLARLLRGLHTHAGLPLNRIHLIGFSLGAHVAGFAGSELDGNISRITGLDPAGPLFESQDPRARLDSTDATFVDVIHSNGDNLILGGLGSWQPMGHVDFYPNGGRVQKGCSHLFLGAITDAIWSRTDAEGQSLCNHRRAYKFFVESISPACHFPAFPCDSFEDFVAGKCYPCSSERTCGNMGYYADRSAGRGQLYLMTRDEEPFCVHQYQVKIESSAEIDDKIEKSYGKIVLTILGETGFNETFTMTHKDDEELIVSGSLTKLLILNPYLEEPVGVEILYIAYSGWLSSGLKNWRIDKILFTDSFGKSLSVCQKGLYLKSEHPVSLPLYPGHCNPPKPKTDDSRVLEDRISLSSVEQPKNEQNKTKDDKRVKVEITSSLPSDLKLNKKSATYDERLLSTPIVHVDNKELLTDENFKKFDEKETNFPIRNMMDFFNLPWRPLLEYTETNNNLDSSTDEKEASRALNIRAVRIPAESNHTKKNVSKTNTSHKEIFEPVLKPQHITNKIARSHNLDRTSKNEISEPLLLSTTSRSFSSSSSTKPQRKLGISMNKNTADALQKHWSTDERLVPPVKITADNNWSSMWSNNGIKDSEISESSNIASHIIHNETITDLNSSKGSGIVAITVQFLPHRLANMLDQAERYARMTLLPFISAATPKIITDFVQSITNSQPKYMPLHFEESQTSNTPSQNKGSTPDNEIQINDRIQNIKTLNIRPPILSDKIQDFVNETASINNNSTEVIVQNKTELNNTDMASRLTINTTEIPPNKTEGFSSRVFVVYPQNNNTLSNNETKTETIELNKGEILIESPESLSKLSDDKIVEEHENLQTQSSGLTVIKSGPSKVIKSLNIGEILPTDITSTTENLVANKDFFENFKPSKKIYINLPVYGELSQSNEHESKSDNDNTNVKVESTLPFKYIPLNFKGQNDKA